MLRSTCSAAKSGQYTAAMFKPDMPHSSADLLASLIEEEDWTASLGETLYQIARRVERQTFSEPGRALVNETIDMVGNAMRAHRAGVGRYAPSPHLGRPRTPPSWRCATVACGSVRKCRGRSVALILTLLGSAERAFYLIDRIVDERRSVSRDVAHAAERPKDRPLGGTARACAGGMSAQGGDGQRRRPSGFASAGPCQSQRRRS